MFNPRIFVSKQVTDGKRVGEIFSIDMSPYDGSTPAAYVVGDGFADWIDLEELQTVGAAALATAS
jgi:hypothetical protein